MPQQEHSFVTKREDFIPHWHIALRGIMQDYRIQVDQEILEVTVLFME